MRALILGLGNDLLGDDGVGHHVVRWLRGSKLPRSIDLAESSEAGLALLDLIEGYERVVIVDSVHLTGHPVGTIHRLDLDAFPSVPAPSAHYIGLPDVIRLGCRLGLRMPSRLYVVAIQIDDFCRIGAPISDRVGAAISGAGRACLQLLRPTADGATSTSIATT